MANFLHRLSHWYRLRSIGPRDIARVCGGVLKEVGLSVPGTVLELRNSSTHAGWLINLKAPQDFSLPAVEKLALRLFMMRRISQELKIPMASVRLVVSFNGEAKKLPFPATMVNQQWLKTRIGLVAREGKAVAAAAAVRAQSRAVPATPSAGLAAVVVPPAPISRAVPPVQNALLTPSPDELKLSSSGPPKSKTQAELLDDLNRQLDEGDVNVTESGVFDGSLSDFQRAYA